MKHLFLLSNERSSGMKMLEATYLSAITNTFSSQISMPVEQMLDLNYHFQTN